MADKLAGTFYVQTAAEKGAPGVAGQIVRQSVWAAGAVYHNDNETVSSPRYLDVVLVYASNGVISRYMCKQNHTASEANKPSASSSHWTLLSGDFPLYTPLLIADNGDIKLLQSNQILIQKPDGTITAGFSGYGAGADGIRLWIGGADPNSASCRFSENGAGHVANENMYWDEFGYIYQKAPARILWRSLRDEMNASGIYNNYPIDLLKGSYIDVSTGSQGVTAILPNPNGVPHAIVKTRIIMTTRSTYGVELKCTTGDIFAIVDGAKSYINSIRSDYSTISSVYDEYSQTWEWYAER